jgi:hypothetical protein
VLICSERKVLLVASDWFILKEIKYGWLVVDKADDTNRLAPLPFRCPSIIVAGNK